ncbi:MAG TPA: DUF427 domain-containing protein [Burkholderiaceae bacterium]|nr:DUF427 domain-containing protein [Burkholderiaceae bacterium]
MPQPTPDHPIAIAPHPQRVRVVFNGRVIADTRSALTVQESKLPAVQYVPRQDADMSVMARSEHRTHCPYKGDASHYTLRVDGKEAVNAVWSYEAPNAPVAQLAGYLAFYPDRVDAIEELAD